MKTYKTYPLKTASCRRLGRSGLFLVFVMTGLFLAACASVTPESENPDNLIAERAQARWDALLSGDYRKAYSFYSPGYRSTTSAEDLAFEIRTRRVLWTSAQYKEHSCQENSCTVSFEVGFTVNRPVPGLDKWDSSEIMEEKWVKTGGEWWYVPHK